MKATMPAIFRRNNACSGDGFKDSLIDMLSKSVPTFEIWLIDHSTASFGNKALVFPIFSTVEKTKDWMGKWIVFCRFNKPSRNSSTPCGDVLNENTLKVSHCI